MNRWGLVFFLLVLAGCPHRLDWGPSGEPTTPEEVLRRVDVSESQVVALEGDARISLDSPRGKGTTSMFMAAVHPALLRLEILDFFNRPVGALVTDGETCSLNDGQNGKFYRGPASPQNLSRILPLAIPPKELVALMLGRAPRIPHESVTLGFEPKTQVLVLTLKNGHVTQTLHVKPPEYRVVWSHVEGVQAYDVAFEALEDIGRLVYPRRVIVTTNDLKAELSYKDVQVNQAPDLTLFELEPPPRVPVTVVDALGNPVVPGGAATDGGTP